MNRTSLPLTCLPISKFFSLITSFIFWCVKVQKELPCVTGSVIGKRTISMNASEYPGTETRNSLEKDHGTISSPGCLLMDWVMSKRRCSFRTLSCSARKKRSEDLHSPEHPEEMCSDPAVLEVVYSNNFVGSSSFISIPLSWLPSGTLAIHFRKAMPIAPVLTTA